MLVSVSWLRIPSHRFSHSYFHQHRVRWISGQRRFALNVFGISEGLISVGTVSRSASVVVDGGACSFDHEWFDLNYIAIIIKLKFEFNGYDSYWSIFSSFNEPSDVTCRVSPLKTSDNVLIKEGSLVYEKLWYLCFGFSSLWAQFSDKPFFRVGPIFESLLEVLHLSSNVYFRSSCFSTFV